jgi:hypothetical protein
MRATTVEAQHFLLRDAAGKLMGELAVRDGKPVLELYGCHWKSHMVNEHSDERFGGD